MTLYNRPRAEVFADNAPPSEIQPFQAWLRGLGIAFDETNGLPEMTGLNGLFNALNQYIKYLEQNGFAEWTSTLEYPIGAGVRVGSIWYRARTRNTNKPPATSQNDWAVFLNGADVASASTTVKGIVQLSNVLNSTSTSLALTAAQGKVLQDNKLDKSGGTVSGILTVDAPLRSKQYIDLGYGESLDANRSIVFYSTNTSKRGQITSTTSGVMEFSGAASYSFDKTVDASISGNAASATKLATARTIGGVSFNGTTNINLPGVNIAGNQNTSGNAATATTAANCSRSIVAGNGLLGGGDLTENRTLTLGTPGTVTASTGNAVSASSHTHNLDVNSLPLLGVGQTWQKPSRSLGTTYTNNTGRPIQVFICANLDVGSFDISGVKMDIVDGDTYCFVNCIIPAGATYSLRSIYGGASIVSWAELR